MTKKIKKIRAESFEWLCNNCKSMNIEKHIDLKAEQDNIRLTCTYCGTIRPVKLIELPEEGLSSDWISEKCPQCLERFSCLHNAKSFYKRQRLITKLGFCEEYVVDSSQLLNDSKQVCHEEISFGELYNEKHSLDEMGQIYQE